MDDSEGGCARGNKLDGREAGRRRGALVALYDICVCSHTSKRSLRTLGRSGLAGMPRPSGCVPLHPHWAGTATRGWSVFQTEPALRIPTAHCSTTAAVVREGRVGGDGGLLCVMRCGWVLVLVALAKSNSSPAQGRRTHAAESAPVGLARSSRGDKNTQAHGLRSAHKNAAAP